MTDAFKVLVAGKTGQLARELQRAEWPRGWSVEFADRTAIDLAKPSHAAAAVLAAKPNLVVNAAAYTAVDKAESEPDLADAINALAPAAMAASCAKLDIPFVTMSTDYVFDGMKRGAYTEDDSVAPLSAYGRSKARGEALVREAHKRHLILRSSWVFSPFGANFVRTMLRIGGERSTVSVVNDQRGKPTAAGDLARAVIAASEAIARDPVLAGTHHVADAEPVTWHDFAVAIFHDAQARGARVPETVRPITTAEYKTPAKRPANSELACAKFEHAFQMRLPSWREALPGVLDELLAPARAAH